MKLKHLLPCCGLVVSIMFGIQVLGAQIPFAFFKSFLSPVDEGAWCVDSGGVYGTTLIPTGACDWNFTSPGTYAWTAPADVTSVSVVLIGGGGAGHMSSISAAVSSGGTSSVFGIKATGGNGNSGGGTLVNNADNITLGRTAEGQGGIGVGGDGNWAGGNGVANQSGGGGAAGYTANGGIGVGTGSAFGEGYGGGGVGIFGGSAGGSGGTSTAGGSGGSGGETGTLNNGASFGGGGGSDRDPGYGGGGRLGSGGGGGLAYKNGVTVVPGNSYTVVVGAGGRNNQGSGGGGGAVRIIWGAGRSFPNTNVSAAGEGVTLIGAATVTSANKSFYENKRITVLSGAVLTVDTSDQLNWLSLDLRGTSKIVTSACTTTACTSLNLNIAESAKIASGASIDVDGKGYLGGSPGRTFGNTTTGGATSYSGGSHGGYGGSLSGVPNEVYGSVLQPTTHGAGGGSAVGNGATAGGGVVKIVVGGTLTLDGKITANGAATTVSNNGGSGAGGSIWIAAGTIASSVSSVGVTANGGPASGGSMSAGGGGRIAIYYGSLSGFSIDSTRVQAYGGDATGTNPFDGGAGTIYSKMSSETSGDLLIAGPSNSNFKDTKFGIFGKVGSIATTTLTADSSTPLMATAESLAGKTIVPDMTAPAVIRTLSSGTTTTLVASASFVGATATGKYFYVKDHETGYRNVSLGGVARVVTGYLDLTGTLAMGDSSKLTAYSIQNSGNSTLSDSSFLSVLKYSSAGNITLNGSSRISTFPASATEVFALDLLANNVTISSLAGIDLDGMGYLGGTAGRTYGNTTTGGSTSYSGGSHGGYGGSRSGVANEVYGSVYEPVTHGAGGAAGSSYIASAGGGVLRMNVTSTLTIDGRISADGASATGNYSSTGAGGSIWINAGMIASSGSGVGISANGGVVSGTGSVGGGGGRVAVYYGSLSGFSFDPARVQAYGSDAVGTPSYDGGPGTVYSKQNAETYGDLLISGSTVSAYNAKTKVGVFGTVASVSSSTLTANASTPILPGIGSTTLLAGKTIVPDVMIPGVTMTASSSTNTTLVATGAYGATTSAGRLFHVKDYEAHYRNVTVSGVANLETGVLNLSGDFTVTTSGVVNAHALSARDISVSGTATVNVLVDTVSSGNATISGAGRFNIFRWNSTGDVALNDTAIISTFPSTTTDVYGISISAANMTMASGAKIDADGLGYLGGSPGRTVGNSTTGGANGRSGGSHGGYGGNNSGTPNEIYGSVYQPVNPGAGGGSAYLTGTGGGAIRLNISSALVLNGTVSANGQSVSGTYGAGGAGGSIWISANALSSTNAGLVLSANGGGASGTSTSDGGGGRIAVHAGSISGLALNNIQMQAYGANQSTASWGGPGTIYLKLNSEARGDLLVSGPSNSPYKNTKVGVFGQVGSVSTTTLTAHATTPLLPGNGDSLVGKTIVPDVAFPGVTRTLASNTNTTLIATATYVGATAAGKFFCVTDYETEFRNVILGGVVRLETGCFDISEALQISGTAQISAYRMNAKSGTVSGGAAINVPHNLTFQDDVSFAGATVVVGGTLSSLGTVTLSGASNISADKVLVSENLTMLNTSLLKTTEVAVTGDITLSNTTQMTTFDPTTANVSSLLISAANMSIDSGARVDVNGRGYLGGATGYTFGNTTTGGASGRSGGSHGGYGGNNGGTPNEVYGSVYQPTTHGSGGGSPYATGNGGGAVRLDIVSTLTLNGLISANGEGTNVTYGCGGAGGSIWINAGTISSTGSAVALDASGGISTGTHTSDGGGGRIAIYYASLSGFSVDSSRVRAQGGNGSVAHFGGPGTIFSKASADTYGDLLIVGASNSPYKNTKVGVFGQVGSISTTTLTAHASTPLLPGTTESLAGKTVIPDIATPAVTRTVATHTKTTLVATATFVGTTVPGNFFYVSDHETTYKSLTVDAVRLDVGYINALEFLELSESAVLNAYELDVGDLNASDSSSIVVKQGVYANGNVTLSNTSNASANDFETVGDLSLSDSALFTVPRVIVGGDIAMTGTSKLTVPAPTTTLVHHLHVSAANMNIGSTALVDVDGMGYLGGNPGRTIGNVTTGGSTSYSGGSHGGYGGHFSSGVPAEVYGDLTAPVTHGSGGGSSVNAAGGGAVRLDVTSTLTLNGMIRANGVSAVGTYGASGAGGSVWVNAGTIASSGAGLNISANGGSNTGTYGTGGGGGRIAIYYGALSGFSIDTTRVQAFGGDGQNAQDGGAGSLFSRDTTLGQSSLLYSGGTRTSSYARTKTMLTQNLSLQNLTVEGGALVRQNGTAFSLVTDTLTIQGSGALEVPTDGAAGYGSWFQYNTLNGGPAPTEY